MWVVMYKQTGKVGKDRLSHFVQDSEFATFVNHPRIVPILKEIENRKDFTLGMISLLLAGEVYKIIQAAGLYTQQYGEAFELDGAKQGRGKTRERIIAGSKFSNTLESVFSLIRTLKTDYGSKGQIVANLFTTHLGIKIVSDRALSKAGNGSNRRDVILDALQLYYMPVGLYDGSWNELPVAEVDPSVMFDIQEVNRNILLLRMQPHTKVDTNSFSVVVRMITEVMRRNKNDNVVQNWGTVKLRELETFAQSLGVNWLHKVEYRVTTPLEPKENNRKRSRNRSR